MFSDMPREILDEIVDCAAVDSEPEDVANWALVCRSLRSRAQQRLYEEISIETTERIMQLMELMQENPLISNYLVKVHVSPQQFILYHHIDTTLASLFLLVEKQACRSSLHMVANPGRYTRNLIPQNCFHDPQNSTKNGPLVVTRLDLESAIDFPAQALFSFRRVLHLTFKQFYNLPGPSLYI